MARSRGLGDVYKRQAPVGSTAVDPETGAVFRNEGHYRYWDVVAQGSPLVCERYNGLRHESYKRPLKDADLRPLRDNEDEDEMLRIAGKPVTQGERSECLQNRMA
jgi:hypothetical protein